MKITLGKKIVDKAAVEAGLNGIAFPAEGIIAHAVKAESLTHVAVQGHCHYINPPNSRAFSIDYS